MLSRKYLTIKAGIFALTLSLFLTAFTGFALAEGSAVYEGRLITTHGELKTALNEAKDGDVIYVGDIDFTRTSPNVPKSIMQIDVSKSITIKSGKRDGAATFTNGMFLLKGNKADDAITPRFENIIFDGTEQTDRLTWSDRLYPWDAVDEVWQYDQPTMASHALSFFGNVDATFESCEFKNYVHENGAVAEIYYGDYTDNEALSAYYPDQSGCRLDLTFNKCSMHDNAAFYKGGALYIEACNNVTLNMHDCALKNNLCGGVLDMSGRLYAYSDGGGAVYASEAEVNMTGCEICSNECNRVFTGRELLENYVNTRGGGMHLSRCLLSMTDCRVYENVGSMGGGLALTDCKADIDGCSFFRNRAEGRGTALERKNKGPWSNMAQGGALYIEGTANKTVSLINCSVTDNFAEVAYGGIYQYYYIDPSLGVSYTKLYLCTYATNTCGSSYSYEGVDPMWIGFSVPIDLWASEYVTAKGCVLIDDDFSLMFPINERPCADNDYNYYAPPALAAADGLLTQQDGAHTVLLPEDDAWQLPAEVLSELVGERYDGRLTRGTVGSNYSSELYKAEVQRGGDTDDGDKTEPRSYAWLYVGMGAAVLVLICFAAGILLSRRKIAAQMKGSENEPPATKPQKQIIIARYSDQQIDRIMTTMPEVQQLTDREREIFHEMLLGKKQSEIASHLFISASTVKDYYQRIYSKMNVTNKDALLEKIFEETKNL